MTASTISIDEVLKLCTDAFVHAGAIDKNAGITAKALVRAETDGQKGHGLSRVPSYSAQVSSGK